jgi:hypothetical protein
METPWRAFIQFVALQCVDLAVMADVAIGMRSGSERIGAERECTSASALVMLASFRSW